MADRMGMEDLLDHLERILSEHACMQFLLTHYSVEPNRWRTLLRDCRQTPAEQSRAPERIRELSDYLHSHPVDVEFVHLLTSVLDRTL